MVRNKPKSKLHAVLPLCNHHRKHQGVPGMLSFDTSSSLQVFSELKGVVNFVPRAVASLGTRYILKIEISNTTAFITRPTDVGICQLAWTI